MDKKHVSQIQCPKCGEYRMARVEKFGVFEILLSILTFGLYAFVSAIIASKTKDPYVRKGNRVKCLNCESRWVYEGERPAGSTETR
jgi:DNA-directed RNA polymerase subunit RPC12/RpoP